MFDMAGATEGYPVTRVIDREGEVYWIDGHSHDAIEQGFGEDCYAQFMIAVYPSDMKKWNFEV